MRIGRSGQDVIWNRWLRVVAVTLVLITLTLGESLATNTQFTAFARNGLASLELQLVGAEDPYPQVRYRDLGAHAEGGAAKFDMARMDVVMDRPRQRLSVVYRGAGKAGELPSFELRVRGNHSTVEIGGMTLRGEANWEVY